MKEGEILLTLILDMVVQLYTCLLANKKQIDVYPIGFL